MARTAFFISDGTGITAETLGHSLLSQFGGIKFDQVTIPYVASDDLTREAVARIDRTAQTDGAKPIVFSTLVNDDHRAILHTCKEEFGGLNSLLGSYIILYTKKFSV